ncbi:Zinc metalloprotease (elastase) [Shewanella psychrophila]|uniref:Neutral metalloproteinase n=2 Tax=Shewanella psychrophila TaxID=225848 RepID=A0A1S6HT18_9GAMM|nr:Zinc metalloprotease (elastase) [Shewanella psychrophila]
MIRHTILWAAGIFTALSSFTLYAAERFDLDKVKLDDTVMFDSSSASIPIKDLNQVLALKQEDSIRPVAEMAMSGNRMKVRYQQLYKGIPIYGESLVVEKNTIGFYTGVSGQFIRAIGLDLPSSIPLMSTSHALTIAKSDLPQALGPVSVDNEQAVLRIYLDENDKARLVYITSFVSYGNSISRPFKIIDANNGDILRQWEGMTFKLAGGPGGNQKSGKYYFGNGGKYGSLITDEQCRMDSTDVVTYNMYHNQYGGVIHQFNCPNNDNDEVNGAYSPLNDAHYFGQQVFNMYQEWFGLRPINMKLKMRVHYGYNYANAFWDGQQMTFGDGGQSMYPLTTWDVVSHEVSHGFTEQNSGLEYYNQSGGMNESFSDIAAAALGYYMHGTFNWKMGEHVMKYSGAMRYLDSPAKDGMSIESASQYYDGMDPHLTSGVFNKAFYHLATSEGWNIKKAFELFVIANRLYWTPRSTYQSGADGVCRAAADKEFSQTDVSHAFSMVGVTTTQCDADNPGKDPNDDSEILINGRPVTLTGQQHQQRHFTFNLPEAATKLTFSTQGGASDIDLYVKYNQQASDTDFDCLSAGYDSNEECQFTHPVSGIYNVMLYSFTDYDDVTLIAYYERDSSDESQYCRGEYLWSPMHFYYSDDFVNYRGFIYQAHWAHSGELRPDINWDYDGMFAWRLIGGCD